MSSETMGRVTLPAFIWILVCFGSIEGCNFGSDTGCLFQCQCLGGDGCDELTGYCQSGCATYGIGQFWSGFGCLTGLVSEFGSATQSGPQTDANAAMDGRYSTCAHPQPVSGLAWWTVDLIDLHVIQKLNIMPAQPSDISHLRIYVSNSSTAPSGEICYTESVVRPGDSNQITVECDSPIIGRTVTLSKQRAAAFTLCNVEVIGHRYIDCTGCSGHCNSEYGCVDTCPSGKNQSTLCSEDCDPDEMCPGSCGYCKTGTTCDTSTGQCPKGCQPWWVLGNCSRFVKKIEFSSTVYVQDVESNSFVLSWDTIFGNIDADLYGYYGYRIRYRVSHTGKWEAANMPAQNNSFIIRDLSPDTYYEYYVVSYREVQKTEYSQLAGEPSSIKTKCRAPDAPDDVIVNVTTTKTISVTWRLPDDTGCKMINKTEVWIRLEAGSHPEEWRNTSNTSVLLDLRQPGNYTVSVRVYNNDEQKSDWTTTNFTLPPIDRQAPWPGFDLTRQMLMIIVVSCGAGSGVLCVFILAVVVCRRRGKKKRHQNNSRPTSSRKADADNSNGSAGTARPVSQAMDMSSLTVINAANFSQYFRDSQKHEQIFKDRFHKIPKEQLSSSHAASLKPNIKKNRYKNIIPYDQNRVPLDEMHGIPNSDYINASFITGYPEVKHRYIAAQGPTVDTLEDFWRMIAMYDVTCIVMLTSLAENGKKLCEHYWPAKLGERKVFGTAVVKLDDEVTLADCTIRNLNVTCQGKFLNVRHYQITSWRDKTKPDSPLPMMNLLNRVRITHSDENSPTLVHCSAGAGRTGTYIGTDCLLDQAALQGQVAVDTILYRMRMERPWMVQTLNQYIFIHELLVNYFTLGQTLTPVENLMALTPDITDLFQSLASIHFTETPSKAGSLAENLSKNRNTAVIPDDKHRPYLCQPYELGNDYINAVFCDSIWRHDNIILTQLPLPDTIVDFWIMVFDHDVASIVILDNLDLVEGNAVGQFWPDECQQVYGPLVLEGLSKTVDPANPSLVIWDITIALHRKPQESLSVTVYQYMSWASCELIPANMAPFLSLVYMLELSMNSPRRTVIQCLDGVSHSSVFLAACHVVSQCVLWQDVDVPLTVLALRERRPTSIMHMEQFQFLYDLVRAHVTANKRGSAISMAVPSNVTPLLPRSKSLNHVLDSTNHLPEPQYGNVGMLAEGGSRPEYMDMIESAEPKHNAECGSMRELVNPRQGSNPGDPDDHIYANTIESTC